MNGKRPWAEAAGPFAHYLYEEKAGMAVLEPMCSGAVDAMQFILEQEGWLPVELSKKTLISAQKPRVQSKHPGQMGIMDRRKNQGR